MGPGKRCKGGYHLRGTVAATPTPDYIPPQQNVGSNPGVSGSVPITTPEATTFQPQQQNGGSVVIDPANLKDFLGKMIREEIAAAMSQQATPPLNPQQQQQQQQPPPPPTLQPHQPQQPPQSFKLPQDYRMALIGELLSKH